MLNISDDEAAEIQGVSQPTMGKSTQAEGLEQSAPPDPADAWKDIGNGQIVDSVEPPPDEGE
jgi:hypothetical protein